MTISACRWRTCLSAVAILSFAVPVWARPFPLKVGPVVPVLDLATGVIDFAEGIAVSPRGNLYVGLGYSSRIMKVDPNGKISLLADLSGNPFERILLGLAVDDDESIYAALWDLVGDQGGLWKVAPSGRARLLMPMPPGSIPNAIAFDPRGNIYVTNSLGSIWRLGRDGSQGQWAQGPLLVGASFGANGIAYRDGALWVLNSDEGMIVNIPIGREGGAGVMRVLASSPALVGADGAQFDVAGNLWVGNVYTSELLRVSRRGEIEVAITADEFAPFWSTTNPVFGFGRDGKTLYISGVFSDPVVEFRAAVVKVNVGIPGMLLPQLAGGGD